LVKLIGDGAMFVGDDAVDACTAARRLVDALATDDVVPPVRVGLAAGPVMSLYGDYFGDVVNLAARLVALAPPSSVGGTDEGVRRCGDAFTYERLEPRALGGCHAPPPTYPLTTG